jgi:hypothetical protein
MSCGAQSQEQFARFAGDARLATHRLLAPGGHGVRVAEFDQFHLPDLPTRRVDHAHPFLDEPDRSEPSRSSVPTGSLTMAGAPVPIVRKPLVDVAVRSVVGFMVSVMLAPTGEVGAGTIARSGGRHPRRSGMPRSPGRVFGIRRKRRDTPR